jgi:hypothetical protein
VDPAAALIVFLMAYAAVGAALALNYGHIADRLGQRHRRLPWLLRQIGRDNPNSWRAAGVVALAFGVVVDAWLLSSAVWQPPPLTSAAAITVLLIAALSCLLAIALSTGRRR